MMLRPPKGQPFHEMKLPMETRQGTDKRAWLSWDGERAQVRNLDTYVLNHRRRMKPCTSFDKLTNDSGENDVFGDGAHANRHFDGQIGAAVGELAADFPQEAALYKPGYDGIAGDDGLSERIRVFNPMNYIDDDRGAKAQRFRIRVGASDADTAFTISMTLALRLQNAGHRPQHVQRVPQARDLLLHARILRIAICRYCRSSPAPHRDSPHRSGADPTPARSRRRVRHFAASAPASWRR